MRKYTIRKGKPHVIGCNYTNGGAVLKRLSIWSALYLPHTGGVENFTRNAADALAKRGVAVQVVTSQLGGSPEHEIEPNGVEVWRLPARPLMSGRLPVPQKGAQYKRLMGEIERFAPEAVLVNTRFYPHSAEGLKFAQRIGAKAAVLDHGSAHLVLGSSVLDAGLAAYEHAVTARAKSFHPQFFGISQKSAEWLTHFGINPTGIIQNAIDAPAFRAKASDRDFRAEFGIAPDDLLIAFCGRLVPEKGPDKLLEALTLLDENVDVQEGGIAGIDDGGDAESAKASTVAGKAAAVVDLESFAGIKCIFAGDGPLREQLEAKAREQAGNGAPCAFFPGNLDPADLSALLQQANVFCLPTRSEGFCTSLLEASACGVPSAITDVGGARELIPDAGVGFIVPDSRPASIAATLRKAKGLGPAALADMGKRAQRHVEEVSSWEQTADAILAAFSI